MTKEQIEALFIAYVSEHGGIDNCFGHFKFNASNRIGQGGNGIVYSATIDEKFVAIKFLITDSSKKKTRFKSEFFNTNYVKENLLNTVNMIHYDELNITNELSIPYVIMSKYEKSLKQYRASIDTVTMNDFNDLAKFLWETVASLHNSGIVHRDIKPENILMDSEKRWFLSDFGIAHFDNNAFPIDNKTSKGERLANIEFSAPEQINNSTPATFATDIYSIAQVLYWFVFKTTNRGTGGQRFSTVFDNEDAYIYDDIIYKCINNNPEERFQLVGDILVYLDQKRNIRKEINPYEDMYEFSTAIRSVVPEFYNKVHCIDDKDEMQKLFDRIFSIKYNHSLEFNSGKGNNTISSIIRLENNDFLMDYRQLNIIRIWGLLTNDVYDDILLLEIGKSAPYVINDIEYYGVAQLNGNEFVPINLIESGFVRYNGEVVNINDLSIQERYIHNDYNVIAIAPFHNCCIIEDNDRYMNEMQLKSSILKDDIIELKKKIHQNKAYDVKIRM